MANYATGKYAKAICPRCGYKYPYQSLVREWTGKWVCPDCYEPKHPQIEPIRNIFDPQALDHPYPDTTIDSHGAVNAIDYNGSTNYLSKALPLFGLADTAVGSLNLWVRFDGGDSSAQTFFADSASRFVVSRLATNKFQILGKDTSGATILDLRSSTSYTSGSTWYNLLASWDLTNSNFFLYVNGSSDKDLVTGGSGTIDYTAATYAVGATTAAANLLNGGLSQMWFHHAHAVDLSAAAIRYIFRTAQGYPGLLGIDGSLPTTTVPPLFLPNDINTVGYNNGAGGHFATHGTFATASTSPSDES